MKDLFAKCGFNCGRCAAYKENARTDEDKQRGSDGWKKYFGFQMRTDRMCCDGCQTPDDENPVLLSRGCPIRKCAMINGAETCAHCSAFTECMHDLRIHEADVDRKEMEAELGSTLTEEDYVAFIEPHEHLRHLDELRASLNPNVTVRPKIVPVRTRLIDFPDSLPLAKKTASGLSALHRILGSVVSVTGNTHAQQVVLKKRKQHLVRLLWTFGLLGELETKGSSSLVMNAETYLEQGLPGSFNRVLLYFKILEEHGVRCEVIPLEKEKYGEQGWLTRMGWLRKKGWCVKMFFERSAGGVSALKALRTYAKTLEENYGDRALGYFQKGDMRIFAKRGK